MNRERKFSILSFLHCTILILEVIVLERLVNDMDPSDKEFLNQILWIN